MTVGDRIKQIRESIPMSQVDLANACGISKQTLYKYENNLITNIPSDKIELIAEKLGTTPALLMGWERFKKSPRIANLIISKSKELKINLSDIATATGVSEGTVKQWEEGFVSNLLRDKSKIERLSKILQISPIVLLGIDDDYIETHEFLKTIIDPNTAPPDMVERDKYIDELIKKMKQESTDIPSVNGILPLPKTKKVPLVGTIACGEPITAVENIEDYINMPESIYADFCLKCKGDSMINARIFDGDIVYIKQQPDVENGEIAAVLIESEATLKRVFKHKDSLELRAENPTFSPLYFEGTQLNDIRILGKAVAFLSGVR